MTTMAQSTTQVYQVFIKATPEQIWDAITKPEFTSKYFYGGQVESTLEPGTPYLFKFADGSTGVEGEVLDSDPPRRLVHTWRSLYDPELADEEPSRVTWEIEPDEGGRLQADDDPRPTRALAEDGRERLGRRLDAGAERPEDRRRDGRAASGRFGGKGDGMTAQGAGGVPLDRFTISLLLLRSDAPQLDEQAAAALQDAHLGHLADLHDAGHLLAAGPVLGGPGDDLRGLSILNVEPEQARGLKEAEPAVRAGRYSIKVLPWLVPGGAMSFSRTRFPRSTKDVAGA